MDVEVESVPVREFNSKTASEQLEYVQENSLEALRLIRWLIAYAGLSRLKERR